MPTESWARTARSLLAIAAVSFTLFLLAAGSIPAIASQPRSNYALNVIVNDSPSGAVDISLQLQQITGNSSFLYWARYMDANITLGPQLSWTSEGASGGSVDLEQENVSGNTYFNVTAYIDSAMRKNMTADPSTTYTASFAATVVYSDNFGYNNRTIVRTVSFVLNYVAPPPAPVISILSAAALGVGGAGAVGGVLYVRRRARLDELYLMHDSGMLIRHWSRNESNLHDSDILSGMLMVLQEFVRDTWKAHQDEDAPLEQLRFGTQRVLLARGSHSVLAAVVRGRYVNGLPRRLSVAVTEFERSNAARLADWNGNVDVFPQVDQIAQQLLGRSHAAA